MIYHQYKHHLYIVRRKITISRHNSSVSLTAKAVHDSSQILPKMKRVQLSEVDSGQLFHNRNDMEDHRWKTHGTQFLYCRNPGCKKSFASSRTFTHHQEGCGKQGSSNEQALYCPFCEGTEGEKAIGTKKVITSMPAICQTARRGTGSR